MKNPFRAITDFINSEVKKERKKDLAIHRQKIYHAFYNHNIAMDDVEISETLEELNRRIKQDLVRRKQEKESEFLQTEKGLDKVNFITT